MKKYLKLIFILISMNIYANYGNDTYYNIIQPKKIVRYNELDEELDYMIFEYYSNNLLKKKAMYRSNGELIYEYIYSHKYNKGNVLIETSIYENNKLKYITKYEYKYNTIIRSVKYEVTDDGSLQLFEEVEHYYSNSKIVIEKEFVYWAPARIMYLFEYGRNEIIRSSVYERNTNNLTYSCISYSDYHYKNNKLYKSVKYNDEDVLEYYYLYYF